MVSSTPFQSFLYICSHIPTEKCARGSGLAAMKMLDLMNVTRASASMGILESLREGLINRLDNMEENELEEIMEASYPYIGFHELRQIPIAIMQKHPNIPPRFLSSLKDQIHRLHLNLPVEILRQIWKKDEISFLESFKPLLKLYLVQYSSSWSIHSFQSHLKHILDNTSISSLAISTFINSDPLHPSAAPSHSFSTSSDNLKNNDLTSSSSRVPPSSKHQLQILNSLQNLSTLLHTFNDSPPLLFTNPSPQSQKLLASDLLRTATKDKNASSSYNQSSNFPPSQSSSSILSSVHNTSLQSSSEITDLIKMLESLESPSSHSQNSFGFYGHRDQNLPLQLMSDMIGGDIQLYSYAVSLIRKLRNEILVFEIQNVDQRAFESTFGPFEHKQDDTDKDNENNKKDTVNEKPQSKGGGKNKKESANAKDTKLNSSAVPSKSSSNKTFDKEQITSEFSEWLKRRKEISSFAELELHLPLLASLGLLPLFTVISKKKYSFDDNNGASQSMNFHVVSVESSLMSALGSLRFDLLMAQHDRSHSSLCKSDELYRFAWCMDGVKRDKAFERRHFEELEQIFSGLLSATSPISNLHSTVYNSQSYYTTQIPVMKAKAGKSALVKMASNHGTSSPSTSSLSTITSKKTSTPYIKTENHIDPPIAAYEPPHKIVKSKDAPFSKPQQPIPKRTSKRRLDETSDNEISDSNEGNALEEEIPTRKIPFKSTSTLKISEQAVPSSSSAIDINKPVEQEESPFGLRKRKTRASSEQLQMKSTAGEGDSESDQSEDKVEEDEFEADSSADDGDEDKDDKKNTPYRKSKVSASSRREHSHSDASDNYEDTYEFQDKMDADDDMKIDPKELEDLQTFNRSAMAATGEEDNASGSKSIQKNIKKKTKKTKKVDIEEEDTVEHEYSSKSSRKSRSRSRRSKDSDEEFDPKNVHKYAKSSNNEVTTDDEGEDSGDMDFVVQDALSRRMRSKHYHSPPRKTKPAKKSSATYTAKTTSKATSISASPQKDYGKSSPLTLLNTSMLKDPISGVTNPSSSFALGTDSASLLASQATKSIFPPLSSAISQYSQQKYFDTFASSNQSKSSTSSTSGEGNSESTVGKLGASATGQSQPSTGLKLKLASISSTSKPQGSISSTLNKSSGEPGTSGSISALSPAQQFTSLFSNNTFLFSSCNTLCEMSMLIGSGGLEMLICQQIFNRLRDITSKYSKPSSINECDPEGDLDQIKRSIAADEEISKLATLLYLANLQLPALKADGTDPFQSIAAYASILNPSFNILQEVLAPTLAEISTKNWKNPRLFESIFEALLSTTNGNDPHFMSEDYKMNPMNSHDIMINTLSGLALFSAYKERFLSRQSQLQAIRESNDDHRIEAEMKRKEMLKEHYNDSKRHLMATGDFEPPAVSCLSLALIGSESMLNYVDPLPETFWKEYMETANSSGVQGLSETESSGMLEGRDEEKNIFESSNNIETFIRHHLNSEGGGTAGDGMEHSLTQSISNSSHVYNAIDFMNFQLKGRNNSLIGIDLKQKDGSGTSFKEASLAQPFEQSILNLMDIKGGGMLRMGAVDEAALKVVLYWTLVQTGSADSQLVNELSSWLSCDPSIALGHRFWQLSNQLSTLPIQSISNQPQTADAKSPVEIPRLLHFSTFLQELLYGFAKATSDSILNLRPILLDHIFLPHYKPHESQNLSVTSPSNPFALSRFSFHSCIQLMNYIIMSKELGSLSIHEASTLAKKVLDVAMDLLATWNPDSITSKNPSHISSEGENLKDSPVKESEDERVTNNRLLHLSSQIHPYFESLLKMMIRYSEFK